MSAAVEMMLTAALIYVVCFMPGSLGLGVALAVK
jgi:hypothetical protein